MEAKNESIKRELLKIPDIDSCRLSDDEGEMEVENEERYEELQENLNVLKTDPDMEDEVDLLEEADIHEEDDEETEKKRKAVSFLICDKMVLFWNN